MSLRISAAGFAAVWLAAGAAVADEPADPRAAAARAAAEAAGGTFNWRGTELRLGGAEVPNAALALLNDLDPPLTSLKIAGDAALTGAGLRSLAALTELESLAVSAPTLSDADVAPLAALTNLRSLTLRTDGDDPALTPAGFAPLAALRKVETLGVGGHDFPADVLATLPETFPNVRELDLNHTFTTDAAAVEAFARLPKLKSLNLGGNPWLPADAAAKVGEICSLETLGLVHTGEKHTRALFDSLEGHPNLRRLKIAVRGDGLTDERVETLLTLPKLEAVSLGADPGPLTDAAVATLARHPNLKELDLSHPNFTDSAVAALKNAPQLETLRLDAVGVTEEAVDALAEMPSLKTLSIGSYFRGPRRHRFLRRGAGTADESRVSWASTCTRTAPSATPPSPDSKPPCRRRGSGSSAGEFRPQAVPQSSMGRPVEGRGGGPIVQPNGFQPQVVRFVGVAGEDVGVQLRGDVSRGSRSSPARSR